MPDLVGTVYTLDGVQPAEFYKLDDRDAYEAMHAKTGDCLGRFPGRVVRQKCADNDRLMAC